MNGANVFLCKGRVELRTNFYFGSKKSARKSNCIKPEMKIKLSLVPSRITEQFRFGLKNRAGKSNCIRPEIKIRWSLYGRISTRENASVNHTGEI